MRHENGAGWERVSGGAQFSGVLKAVELVFDACFGGLTVAVRPSCWSKLRLGGRGEASTSWFGPQHNPQHQDRCVAETTRGDDG